MFAKNRVQLVASNQIVNAVFSEYLDCFQGKVKNAQSAPESVLRAFVPGQAHSTAEWRTKSRQVDLYADKLWPQNPHTLVAGWWHLMWIAHISQI